MKIRPLVVAGVLLCSLSGCSATSHAGPRTPAASPTATGLSFSGGYFALSVPDAAATAAWYSAKLGLHVTMRPPRSNRTTVVVLEGNGLIVELLQADGALPLRRIAPSVHDRMLVHGIVKAGAIVTDLDAAVAVLKTRGVAIVLGPFPATAQQRANVVVRDHDGNLLQLFGR